MQLVELVMRKFKNPPMNETSNLPATSDRTSTILRAARRMATGVTFSLAVAASAAIATPSQADEGLIIRDFVLTRGIAEREPTDTVDAFDVSDSQGYIFARIANDGLPTGVTAVWRYGDTVHAAIDLEVGTSTGWRTWSSANLKAGLWTVELVDAEGIVLAQRSFSVGTSLAEEGMPASHGPSGVDLEQLSQDPAKLPVSSTPQPNPSTAENDG
jgi:hypothetical protein